MTAKREDPEKTEPLEILRKKTETPRKKSRLPKAAAKGQAPGEAAVDQARSGPTLELPASPEQKDGAAKKSGKVFPVVGIGASAGGLEPLETFFANLPTDKPLAEDMAFVIIQHLSPKHKSIIGEILRRDTDLPIQEIQDGMPVEPNNVYFNPPDKEVGLYQGVFHLLEPSEVRHIRLPIDFFFRSLAQDREEKAICIVLSGTGSDGTLGLEAVKGGGV